jgi:MoxR-like ATPase
MTTTMIPTDDNPRLRAFAAAISANVPPLITGNPGIGKSELISSFAGQWGYHVEVVIGSIREASDFLGLPIEVNGQTMYAAPGFADRLNDAPKAMLYLGELTTSSMSVMKAMLRVAQERYVGDLKLADHVVIVADCNPPEIAVDGDNLPGPIANRFLHLNWSLDHKSWFEGAIGGFDRLAAPPMDSMLGDRSDAAQLKAKMSVTSYLRANPSALDPAPPTNPVEAGVGWASPRSWTNAMNALGQLRTDDVEAQLLVMSGCVGRSAASEYMTWRCANDLYDPYQVLADPAIVDWAGDRPDRLYVLMSALTTIALGTPKLWAKAAAAAIECAKANRPDVALPSMNRLIKMQPDGVASLTRAQREAFHQLFERTGQWDTTAA